MFGVFDPKILADPQNNSGKIRKNAETPGIDALTMIEIINLMAGPS
jgi:hypothetical protein